MADRGRKAFPVSSHLCDERWQRHCMDLHKQRLADMKSRIDNSKPETFDIVLSKGKRAMLEKERQTEVDRENTILLQKMVRIKEQDTRAVFRPWTARSTFQWKVGHYYDPATNTKTVDHINLTSSVSPRSIHYYALTRPGTAPPDVTARLRDMQVQLDNTKLLRAITTMRSHYNVEELERRHQDESILVQRISNFRGPEHARYTPPGRSSSATRGSPYLAPQPGRASSSHRPPRPPRVGWPANPPISQQQYYEEAQNRDIPLPSARGSSRPGTAIGGTLEGLDGTSPRYSASQTGSRHGSLRGGSSRHSSVAGDGVAPERSGVSSRTGSAAGGGGSAPSSRPGSAPAGSTAGSRPASATAAGRSGAGPSFSFGSKEGEDTEEQQQQQRPQSTASSSGRGSVRSSARGGSAGGGSEGRRESYSSQRSGSAGAAAAPEPGTSGDDYADDTYGADEGDAYDKSGDQEGSDKVRSRSSSRAEEEEEPAERDEEEEEEEPATRSRSSRGGEEEEAAGEEEEEEAPADDGYADEAYGDDDDGAGSEAEAAAGFAAGDDEEKAEEKPAEDGEEAEAEENAAEDGEEAEAEAADEGYGNDDAEEAEPAAEGGAAEEEEEDPGYAEPSGDDGDGDADAEAPGAAEDDGDDDDGVAAATAAAEDSNEDQKDDDGVDGADAFDADPDADLRAEMRAAEEAEMDAQFAAEMAADGADDDYGVESPGVEAASLGTTSTAKAGGFAADWD